MLEKENADNICRRQEIINIRSVIVDKNEFNGKSIADEIDVFMRENSNSSTNKDGQQSKSQRKKIRAIQGVDLVAAPPPPADEKKEIHLIPVSPLRVVAQFALLLPTTCEKREMDFSELNSTIFQLPHPFPMAIKLPIIREGKVENTDPETLEKFFKNQLSGCVGTWVLEPVPDTAVINADGTYTYGYTDEGLEAMVRGINSARAYTQHSISVIIATEDEDLLSRLEKIKSQPEIKAYEIIY